MTLAELIDRYHAAQPEPISERAVLTPKGHAVAALHRFAATLAALDDADREDVHVLLVVSIDGLLPAIA